MSELAGFVLSGRKNAPKRPVDERVRDFREVEQPLPAEDLIRQAARCMNCGIPFCHSMGCPLANAIPDVNDAVSRRRWRLAVELLHATNPFPEVTGRVCPALCEAACTLSINYEAVSIRQVELQAAERGWEEGWIRPMPPRQPSGKRVAIVGSGPAGLAAAQLLARRGHRVVVFERSRQPGGILRYGIPDFKLEKWVLDRRLEQLRAEGILFQTGVDVGADISGAYLLRTYDALLVAVGASVPRDLLVPGRQLNGIHFALDFLAQQNRRNAGEVIPHTGQISARGKRVVVLGGGDTGADCVGTALRQGARSVCQVELLPEPPRSRAPDNPWPQWPQVLRTSTSHEEGCTRLWSIMTKEFLGANGRVAGLRCVKLKWGDPDSTGRRTFQEVPGSEFQIPADLVLLALGFFQPERAALMEQLGIASGGGRKSGQRTKIDANAAGVFMAGDCVSGPSLVVRALLQGRQIAEAVDRYLRQPWQRGGGPGTLLGEDKTV